MSNYKIGTRKSLLAVTQCTLMKEELESKTNSQCELVKMVTEGDQKTEKPLWQMDGKNFFTKELDTALLNNQVDFVVHSYKDLGSDRPEGIKLAAITKRSFAHDILLIKESTLPKIKELKSFIVGTSSPRRITNIESSLHEFIPHIKSDCKVECQNLRGNVNTRIQKLQDDTYNAITLALAGLERLAMKEDSKKELEKLLDGLTFMILPQKVFPSAASQGALGIEYNENTAQKSLLSDLHSVHCQQTEKEVKKEREIFQNFGGGCHLAVGIHAKEVLENLVVIQKGFSDNKVIDKTYIDGQDLSSLKGKNLFLCMGANDFLIYKKEISFNTQPHQHYYVTSGHCLHSIENKEGTTFWAAGTRTMKKLVQKGLWVNGSSDSFGHEQIALFQKSQALQIMLKHSDWKVLSHNEAKSEVGEVIPAYERETLKIEKAPFDLSSFDIFYWGSFHQYQVYTETFPEIENKIHACGLGKTLKQFKQNNIQVTPIVDIKQLKNICKATP